MASKIRPAGLIGAIVILGGVCYGVLYLVTHGPPAALTPKAKGEDVTVTLKVGGEKVQFLRNPAVIDILKSRYGVTADATKAGSMEMVALANPGVDALWPSNQVAADIYTAHGGVTVAKENIFNSPLVFYAWDSVADALITSGYAVKRPDNTYQVDLEKLATALKAGKKWSEVGLPDLNGKIKIFTTDPLVSNSGNMFAGMLATAWNGGEVPTETSVVPLLPLIQGYFRRLGAMEPSSANLFENFLKQGVGARPIIVSYENQLVEFALTHPESQALLRSRIRTLYPKPTVWSEHPVIAVTPKGKRLIEALKDPDIQRIAWEQHGFRSGLLGAQNDPKILAVTGIPEQITSVVPMPSAPVMDKIIQALGTNQ